MAAWRLWSCDRCWLKENSYDMTYRAMIDGCECSGRPWTRAQVESVTAYLVERWKLKEGK